MTWREWRAAWRWWDVVGFVLLTAGPLIYFIMLFGMLIPFGSLATAKPSDRSIDWVMGLVRLMLWMTGGVAGLGFFWMLVVAPWLGSGDARFTESRTPLVQSKTHRATAWGPCLLVAGGSLVVLIEAIVTWFLTSVWEPSELLSIWLAPIIGILTLHGWRYNRVLQRRVRASAHRAQVCFKCAYSLAEIPNCERCPECGTKTPPQSRSDGGTT